MCKLLKETKRAALSLRQSADDRCAPPPFANAAHRSARARARRTRAQDHARTNGHTHRARESIGPATGGADTRGRWAEANTATTPPRAAVTPSLID